MSLGHSPSIVTSGLQLYLDAANTKSYSGSGTSWADISGNNYNGTTVNSPTYTSAAAGSYFTFSSASSQYASISGSITLSAATFIVWLYRSGSQGDFAGVFFNRGTGGTSGLNFYSTTNNLGYHWNDNANTYNWNSGLTLPDATWAMWALSLTSSSATAYLFQASGVSSATNNVGHGSATMGSLNVGRDSMGRFFNGRIGAAMLYNTNLTQAQLTQNFNALRGRYSI